ncbi:MAG: hypothetical protein A3A80_03295 [Candidatus Terrybacteria bacterium RIFCSPLOWO2_01_FULL_44_24]|uniref:Band 7 domain-containing protein n=1 Tax=Candidatus Terrybacteria bacterium RIFCSPHIGHO2_01_FULL_43_35 TaxID=1802361 RepID=A0A1G2PC88_9BACT|nr:MAG: hypothetical protein A2828_00805 [Candidatus Terrybacteria bacterium RIFCSPHIGHO2_01_FULL_43_35]OHA51155.1 MAG: hypothetical protein A3A80_03295 [Candidatus Terrybacteria bacterium RIFCSPLOWO2_01_FULL_44_24]
MQIVWGWFALVAIASLLFTTLLALPLWLGLILALGIWYFIANSIILRVPPLKVAVLENTITGKLRAVGPGLRSKQPWERLHKEKPFVPFKEDTVAIEEAKYDTKESQVVLAGALQYRPDQKLASTYVSLETSTLTKGVNDRAKSIIRNLLMNYTAQEAIGAGKELEQGVSDAFKDKHGKDEIENTYGIEVLHFSIPVLKLDPEVEEARKQEDIESLRRESKKVEQTTIIELVHMLMEEDPTMTFAEAHDRVKMGQGVSKKILDIRGLPQNGGKGPITMLPLDDKD